MYEALSRRLILAGTLISLVFVALFALGFMLLYGLALEDLAARPTSSLALFAGAVLTVFGLYAVHFLAGFLALFLTVGAIAGEVDAGTLHAVLARPLRRSEYVLGRWLAYTGLMAAYAGVMTALLLVVARLVADYQVPDAPRAIALMVLGVALVLSLSLLGSALWSTLANGVVMFSLFGLAWLAGIIEFLGTALANDGMTNLGIAVSLLVPSDALWRGASFYAQSPAFLAATSARIELPFAATTPPAVPFLLWAVLYMLACLALTVLVFARRDL